MTRSTYLARIVITVVAVFYFQSCDARELDERKWILMESKHFSVHSFSSEKRTRHLLLHLEALRGFFTAAMADVDSFEEKPTQILVIGKSSDFRKLGLPDNYVGFFQSGVSSNYIVVGSSNNMSQAQVILHEYVHFIVRTTEQFVYPKWWDEGYAEYVAGSKLGKMRFDVGLTNEGRLDDYSRGPLRPWEDVLETKTLAGYSRRESAIFYAQSWFLVHYLQNRKDRPPLQDSWRDYSQRLQDGAGAVEAFEHAFHLTMDELRKEIRKYRRGGRFNYLRIPLDVLVSDFEPTAVKVERRDIQNVLGRFALVGGDIERASAWFNKVLEQDSDNAMAQAGLGAALLQSGNIDAAKPYFDAAVRLAQYK